MSVHAFVFILVWAAGCVVALVVNTERRDNEWGGTAPARGRDLACILLGWVYLAGLLVRGCWWTVKAAVEAARRGW